MPAASNRAIAEAFERIADLPWARQTERIVQALQNARVDVLAHPLGRLAALTGGGMPAASLHTPGHPGDAQCARTSSAGLRILALTLALLLLDLAAGCKSLLPKGAETMPVPWTSYQEAYNSIESIEPYRSTREELRAKGIDPAVNPSITILNYTDILQRLTAVGAVTPGHLDRGISECLDSGKRCTAYSIQAHELHAKRVGSFWLDMLNFRRRTVTTGWTFSALIFFVDDLAVFTMAGGQPNINTESMSRNPLGPIQGLGSSAPVPLVP